MLPNYVQCDYPKGDDGKCGVTARRVPGSALNLCPGHRSRLPYWLTISAEPWADAPRNEAAGGASP